MIFKRSWSHSGRALFAAATSAALMMSTMGNAYALSRTSTMSEWSEASEADQKSFLEALGPSLGPTFKTREADILACLNMAAQSSAHADLPVVEIAKACASPPEPSDGQDQSKDI